MAHHVTDENPTHHISECGATRATDHDHQAMRWFHMCDLYAEHATVHHCGECGAKWSDI